MVVAGVAVAAAAASGLWLSFTYQPASAVTWEGVVLRPGGWVKDLHVAAAWISVVAAAAMVGGLIVQRQRTRASWASAAAMTVVLASLLAAVSSGRRLPWSQVALRSVTVGNDYRGVWFIGSHDMLSVSIPGGAIDPGRYRMWLVFHVVIVPICSAVAVLAVVASRRARSVDAVLVDERQPPVVEIVLERDHVADDAP
jgi:hypothetical protein